MPLDKDRKRNARQATPNVTEMLMELSDIHARLLSCFTTNATIDKWMRELDDVMERIFQAIKEQD